MGLCLRVSAHPDTSLTDCIPSPSQSPPSARHHTFHLCKDSAKTNFDPIVIDKPFQLYNNIAEQNVLFTLTYTTHVKCGLSVV